MKRKHFLLFFIACCYFCLSHAQELQFEAKYQTQVRTNYYVDESQRQNLLPQDSIRLIPEYVETTVVESFYDDNTSKTVIDYSYPFGLLEEWITPVTKTITTGSSQQVFIGDSSYSETVEQLSQLETIPLEEFAPFYLGTNNWRLPLEALELDALHLNGYDIVENSIHRLEVKNDSLSMVYDKSQWLEVKTKFYPDGMEKSREMSFYKVNDLGNLVLDIVINRRTDRHTDPCIVKETITQYKNIQRNYVDLQLAPTAENGFVDAFVTDSFRRQEIFAMQIPNTNTVEVYLPLSYAQGQIPCRITDIYGLTVRDELMIDVENPIFHFENTSTGVYNLIPLDDSLIPCKFVYQP